MAAPAAYFALSRDNTALLDELNLAFSPHADPVDNDHYRHLLHRFDWQRGEFCAILVQQPTRSPTGVNANPRLIFGRDVFGRKSLCWRTITSATQQQQQTTENGGSSILCQSGADNDSCAGTFQLSVLPGHANEGGGGGEHDDERGGWHEVPPGNIICLELPTAFANFELLPNAKMPLALRDFHCHLPSMGDFLGQTLRVHTYYPHESVSQNALFRAFKGAQFTIAEGAQQILLGPSEIGTIAASCNELLPLDTLPTQIKAAADQFVNRFASALKGILLSVMPFGHEKSANNLFEVPVLFSGGVDSLMVALMAAEVLSAITNPADHQTTTPATTPAQTTTATTPAQTAASVQTTTKTTPPAHCQRHWVVRMFSVAFGNKAKDNFGDASDRAQAIAAYEYLKSRSMAKYGFNGVSLVLVNVDKEELIECRRNHIAEAIAPSKTVLDDSIGCVLWFASRMKGVDFDTGQKIVGDCPFALVGSGSDEQLGGYARHQTVFKSKGLCGLTDELSMEMHRIGARNFGRDDRIGTANGRSILAPFLEEPLVRWLNTLPTALKTGFGLPATVVDGGGASNKFLLRNALRSLGVPEYFVKRPKRAMQFGTRMVKVEAAENDGGGGVATKLKGHQICEKLLVHYEHKTTTLAAKDGEDEQRGRPLSVPLI